MIDLALLAQGNDLQRVPARASAPNEDEKPGVP
jgi:hypothetical protein